MSSKIEILDSLTELSNNTATLHIATKIKELYNEFMYNNDIQFNNTVSQETMMMFNIEQRLIYIINVYKTRDIDPNSEFNKMKMSLFMLCCSYSLNAVKLMIDELKPDINAKDIYGCTGLYYAYLQMNLDVIKYLYNHTSIIVEPNFLCHLLYVLNKDIYNETKLFSMIIDNSMALLNIGKTKICIEEFETELIDCFANAIEYKADINYTNPTNSQHILMYAMIYNNESLLKILLLLEATLPENNEFIQRLVYTFNTKLFKILYDYNDDIKNKIKTSMVNFNVFTPICYILMLPNDIHDNEDYINHYYKNIDSYIKVESGANSDNVHLVSILYIPMLELLQKENLLVKDLIVPETTDSLLMFIVKNIKNKIVIDLVEKFLSSDIEFNLSLANKDNKTITNYVQLYQNKQHQLTILKYMTMFGKYGKYFMSMFNLTKINLYDGIYESIKKKLNSSKVKERLLQHPLFIDYIVQCLNTMEKHSYTKQGFSFPEKSFSRYEESIHLANVINIGNDKIVDSNNIKHKDIEYKDVEHKDMEHKDQYDEYNIEELDDLDDEPPVYTENWKKYQTIKSTSKPNKKLSDFESLYLDSEEDLEKFIKMTATEEKIPNINRAAAGSGIPNHEHDIAWMDNVPSNILSNTNISTTPNITDVDKVNSKVIHDILSKD